MRIARLLIWCLALAEAILGIALVVLAVAVVTGVGGPWDVNGVELVGVRGWSFAAALAGIGFVGLAAGFGLLGRRRWAPIFAVAVWPLGALFVLLIDRLTPGDSLPIAEFLLRWAIVPGGIAAGMLYLAQSLRKEGGRD